jgi:uncharacterized surface protein with fasciclin (FAS1) repeats
LLFAGELSLENRGGFASIRTKPREMDLSGLSAIEVKAKGDGRTYSMELRVSGQMGASSYRADLATTAGEWKITRIPVDAFQLQAFGQTLPGKAVDLSRVISVGFTLADKKAGAFELEIEYVKGVQSSGAVEPANGGGNLVDVATAAGGFKTLLAAATAADLAGTLSGGGPFTVFAPTDKAFAKLPPGTVEELCKPENREKLANILKYHVLSGRVTLAKALEVREGVTLQGGKVTVKFENGVVRVGPATLVQADVSASNGIIHAIDQVLLPPDSAGEPLSPKGLIELAVDRGVPLFNEGNHAACAAVYEVACEALRAMPGVSGVSRQDLSRALKEMRDETSIRQKAWILRLALDRTADRLDDGK